jgi:hypothetical protein
VYTVVIECDFKEVLFGNYDAKIYLETLLNTTKCYVDIYIESGSNYYYTCNNNSNHLNNILIADLNNLNTLFDLVGVLPSVWYTKKNCVQYSAKISFAWLTVWKRTTEDF